MTFSDSWGIEILKWSRPGCVVSSAQIMIDAHSVIPWFWAETAKIEEDTPKPGLVGSSWNVADTVPPAGTFHMHGFRTWL